MGLSRRVLLLAGLGALAGCATNRSGGNLPDPIWPAPRQLAAGGVSVPEPRPASSISGVISRKEWARGNAIQARVNRMQPPRYITIHHDGMPRFTATEYRDVAARIELIRTAHLKRDGGARWGDIGYHFVIDRAGRVWEARSLAWQGAHVKDHNEGNIGVLCLGNFEEQVPSAKQLAALERFIRTLRSQYGIPSNAVLTHREWRGANTKCPGRNLQAGVLRSRSAGRFG